MPLCFGPIGERPDGPCPPVDAAAAAAMRSAIVLDWLSGLPLGFVGGCTFGRIGARRQAPEELDAPDGSPRGLFSPCFFSEALTLVFPVNGDIPAKRDRAFCGP